jgi:2'-5' RNA ligase
MGRAEETTETPHASAEWPRRSTGGLRLFVAVELPDEAKSALDVLLSGLRELRIGGLRPVRVEALHLTLKFLGDVPVERAAPIGDALVGAARGVDASEARLHGVGGFPGLDSPQVLWVGLAGDLAALARLHHAVEAALAPLGFPPDRRPFAPHLTLARLRDGVPTAQRACAGEALQRLPWAERVPVPVAAISLIQSTLRPQGAEYRTLLRAPLPVAPKDPRPG